jgi:hypothetical protein
MAYMRYARIPNPDSQLGFRFSLRSMSFAMNVFVGKGGILRLKGGQLLRIFSVWYSELLMVSGMDGVFLAVESRQKFGKISGKLSGKNSYGLLF